MIIDFYGSILEDILQKNLHDQRFVVSSYTNFIVIEFLPWLHIENK